MSAFILLLLTASICLASNPGVRVGVKTDAISTFKNKVLPVVMGNIGDLAIADQNGSVGHGLFKVDIDVKNIVVSGVELDVNDTNIVTKAPHEIELTIGGITAAVNMDFSYKTRLIVRGSGWGRANISDTSANVIISVLESNGKPQVTVTSTSVNIGHMDIHLGGGLISTVANFVVGLLNHSIKDSIQDSLTKAISQQGNDALTKLMIDLPTEIDIHNTDLAVNYTLPYDPVVSADYIEGASLGIIGVKSQPNNIPVPPAAPMSAFNATGGDLQVRLSEYVFNTGLYSAFKTGIIQYDLTAGMINPSSTFQLTTTDLGILIPQLTEVYGYNKSCEITIQANAQPTLQLKNSGGELGKARGSLPTAIDIIVEGNGTAISLDSDLQFEIAMYEADWIIKAEIDFVQITKLNVTMSKIGTPDPTGVKNLLDLAFNATIPAVNAQYFGQGIPLPNVPNVSLKNSQLLVEEGYILIEATPVYNITGLWELLSVHDIDLFPLFFPLELLS